MKARVLELIQHSEGHPLVRFDCAAGRALARWSSRIYLPKVSCDYSVEIDLNVELTKEKTGLPGPRVTQLREMGDQVIVNAEIESADADGMLYLRLAEDCLVMVQSSGGYKPGEWIRFECNASDVLLHAHGRV